MNFFEFQQRREQIKRERPDVIDCGATNLYEALASLIPPPTPEPGGSVHRCHLAAQWCDRFGFSSATARRAFVSRGVRDSLSRLFRHYGRRNARAWLPTDNYPVFHELARSTGLQVRTFETLPDTVWPSLPPTGGPELILITNPLKPLGRFLTDRDSLTLRRWLTADRDRRVILDCVYTFGTHFEASTLDLLATEQVILLHSLTKGWLEPKRFGVALMPESDAAGIASEFRIDPPSQASLARARELLRDHATMPHRVAGALAKARECLRAAIPAEMAGRASLDCPGCGYFSVVAMPWRILLTDANILGIPATAFGSRRDNLTILSTLCFCP